MFWKKNVRNLKHLYENQKLLAFSHLGQYVLQQWPQIIKDVIKDRMHQRWTSAVGIWGIYSQKNSQIVRENTISNIYFILILATWVSNEVFKQHSKVKRLYVYIHKTQNFTSILWLHVTFNFCHLFNNSTMALSNMIAHHKIPTS